MEAEGGGGGWMEKNTQGNQQTHRLSSICPRQTPSVILNNAKTYNTKTRQHVATAFVLIKVFRNKYRLCKYHTQVHALHNHALIEMGNNECFPNY
jgi:hypothetical protein